MDFWGMWLNIRLGLLVVAVAYFAAVPVAESADVAAPPAVAPPLSPSPSPYLTGPDLSDTFEVRFGEFIHGVGSVERFTPDVSASIVTPRLNFFHLTDNYWLWFIPRAQIGGSLNVAGRTSFAYLDAMWTVPITNWLFVEPFVGGAVHDGSLTGTATMSDLGCRELFHVGASVGVPINAHWRMMGTFEHLSNGKGIFGTDCGTNQTGVTGGGNQGLNNYGLRFGYAF